MTPSLLTPKWIVEELGAFDLDPAGAPGWQLAYQSYVPEEGLDGLHLPWHGRVWLNPPYGQSTKKFMTRMVNHHQGTALIGARTDTVLFQRYVFGHATAALFVEGRLPLIDSQTRVPATSGASSMALVAYGEDDAIALRRANIKGHFVWMDSAKRTGERTLA